MLGALAVVVVIGLADSLNATTIGPALYLATARGHAGPVIAFAAGVFVVSFLGGIAVVLGLGQLVLGAVPDLSATAKQLIEVGAGAFLLALALVFWARRDRPPRIPGVSASRLFPWMNASSRQRAAASGSSVGPAPWAMACLRSVITSAPSAS